MKVFFITLANPTASEGVWFGITAIDEADAISLLTAHLSSSDAEFDATIAIASIKNINDVSEIEQNHVRPNMGNHLRRGIWYPAVNYDERGW